MRAEFNLERQKNALRLEIDKPDMHECSAHEKGGQSSAGHNMNNMIFPI
jgi:hypothetical protein